MRSPLAALLVAVGSGAALAQPVYTFQMRLIPDGAPGAPTGPGQVFNIGEPASVTATRIGFWLQARVSVTGDAENWGIVRASSPVDGASFIQLNAPVDATITRGTTNGSNSDFGRGRGYRNGGEATGNTGNTGDSQPFPGTGGNENGGLDNGGSGSLLHRVYGFNSWVGATRDAANPDEPSQPWNVNGAAGAGSPVPSDGTFSPWANLYRVWVDITPFVPTQPGQYPMFSMTASAYLTGSLGAVPTDQSQATWEMQEGPGQLVTTSYSYFVVPAPSACAVLLVAAGFTVRRRRI